MRSLFAAQSPDYPNSVGISAVRVRDLARVAPQSDPPTTTTPKAIVSHYGVHLAVPLPALRKWIVAALKHG